MEHVFLVMWCNEGLEYIADLTEHERRVIWNTLKGQEDNSLPNLNALVLRAMYNTHRHYEIYTVSAAEGITEADLKELFEADPQYAADLIRERGRRLYSDRANPNRTKII